MKNILFLLFLIGLVCQSIYSYPIQEGKASYYGKDFHGKRTASGEIFNMYTLTAAHKTLPLGTLVEVTNKNNKKKIVVKINDRGPFVKGRILDLSYLAAKKIDMIEKGTADVIIKPLSADWLMSNVSPVDSGTTLTDEGVIADTVLATVHTVQIGAFHNPSAAFEFFQSTQSLLKNVFINGPLGKEKLYKIQTGSFFTYEEAQSYLKIIHNFGYDGAFITPMTALN